MPLHHTQLLRFATYVAPTVACILILAKFFAWLKTDSMSLQASLIDSLLDLAASLVNFFVIRQALKPADEQHRFGHGKAEALGGLGQSTFIAGSALWLLIDVAHRLIAPHPLSDPETGTVVMIFASILTLGLVLFQKYVVKQTRSMAIAADSLHYQSDLLTNIGVLVSLNLSVYMNWNWLDVLVGASIAGYILYTSWHIGARSLDVLMDRELPDSDREKIIKLALDHPHVLGVHDLRTRSAGLQEFIQMHLDLDDKISFVLAHEISETVEGTIQRAFPHAEVIIHQDPRSVKDSK